MEKKQTIIATKKKTLRIKADRTETESKPKLDFIPPLST